jgi:hypothetical protein
MHSCEQKQIKNFKKKNEEKKSHLSAYMHATSLKQKKKC